jgi:hypothetical protein
MTNTEIVLQQISIGQLQGRIKRYEMIELGAASGGIPTGQTGRFNFLDQPQLRNQPNQVIIIRDIEIFPVTSYAASQYTNGVVGLPIAEIAKVVLVLYINGEESVKYIPLAKLNHIQDATPAVFQQALQGFDNLSNVDWDKSYVQYNSASANGPYIIPFGITYFRFQRDPTNVNNWIEK